LLVLPAVPVHARVLHNEAWAREKFAAAEHLREGLTGRATPDRTRPEYQIVINAYRRVYYGSPSSSKADDSVFAVAELLLEMGRQFGDEKLLHAAIGQYEFLRREYPGSKHRFAALYAIGDVYRYDLDNPVGARAAFAEFVRRYPHNDLADDAQAAIAELDQTAGAALGRRESAPKEDQPKEKKSVAASANGPTKSRSDAKDADGDDSAGTNDHALTARSADNPERVPRVFGIHHWSTEQYTRVAIDLDDTIKFDAQRLPDPERIFFDLRDTKLADSLANKNFDVDDGLLKRIRVAQFRPGRSRVVLEVDDTAEYNAFLTTNPCRLIIDIHGANYLKARAMKDATTAPDTAPKTNRKPSPVKVAAVVSDKDDAGDPAPLKHVIATTSPAGNAANKTAPKKIVVEADDDDEDTSASADVSARERKPAKPSAGKGQATTARRTAMRARGKRRSADGNNDEVATLEPADLGPADKSSPPTVAVERAKVSRAKSKRDRTSESEVVAREAVPTANGDRSLIRALGLKIGRIVIDPGHGGHDTGTIGPNGLMEKDLVLEVAKRLGKLLEARLGADVIYTRQDDTFIPLETRTAIANQEKADLFVSIHANSSHDPDARGVETYYLNFTSNEEALEVAARENAVSDKSIHELQDLVKKIALKEKIDESREFATEVQHSLHNGLAVKSPGIRDRGVKKAPFVVLIGANMPSILAEVSFVSNPTDARKLKTADYRQRIADSLFNGISKYVGGLSGVKVASKMPKSDGP